MIGCDTKESSVANRVDQIDTTLVKKHIQILSSDDFQGRKPFTVGETKTVNYIKEIFEKEGLEPGNGDSYFQDVPMVEITGFPDQTLNFSGSKNVKLNLLDEFVAFSERPESEVGIQDSHLVFAGFGIVAPEYGWNDYEGLDVKGKTVIVLVNDPGFGGEDDEFFKGEAMTYYGRWTYKYEEAARQGAAGVFIVHETVPAGYPWLVVRNSWSGAQLKLEGSKGYQCAVQGWLTRDAAIKVFEASGVDMKNFTERSRSSEFKPIALGLNASINVRNEIKRDVSRNVIAKISGSDTPEEAVVYGAHWDHLGIGPPVDGDSIYNGAHDNASGVALLLSLARTFKQQPEKPKRSVVFLAVTAEEQGLLGSKFYAENPTFDTENIVANINMDGASYFGKMKDLTVIGHGHSDLDDIAERVAKTQNRYIIPDPEAGKGYFFRSDHFNFAKVGVPALYASGSYEAVNGGVEAIAALNDQYLNNRYHRPADEFEAVPWQFGGLYQDGMLYYQVGSELANSTLFPSWKLGSEFKAARKRD